MTNAEPRPYSLRGNTGAGKSEHSWEKHQLMGRALRAQAAKAKMVFGDGGVIVDMHAHDGSGTANPQLDMFDRSESTSSAGLAFATAREHGCDLILCESIPERRQLLKDRFGVGPIYFPAFSRLLHVNWTMYRWAIVLNDPNGHSKHGVEVMQHIAHQTALRADFIVMVNEGSLARHIGVSEHGAADDLHPNAEAIKGCREKAQMYAWMLDPMEWRRRLGKKQIARSMYTTRGQGYRGRLLLLTDSLANLNPEMFTW